VRGVLGVSGMSVGCPGLTVEVSQCAGAERKRWTIRARVKMNFGGVENWVGEAG